MSHGHRFAAFVPIPKGKTGRHRAALLRSWSLGRRSGRVATEPYPPPKPSLIVDVRQSADNRLDQTTGSADMPRGPSASFLVRLRACDPVRRRSSVRVRPVCPLGQRSRSRYANARRCTTQRHKTQNTVTSEVHYPWHPWFGQRVIIMECVNRSGHAVSRCIRDGDESGRALELPQWMLDRAACCRLRLADLPVVRAADLRQLHHLLRQVTSNRLSNVVENRCSSSPFGGATDDQSAQTREPDPTGPFSSPANDTGLGATPTGLATPDSDPVGTAAPPAVPSPRRGRSRRGGGR
jgi:hypothetical protein